MKSKRKYRKKTPRKKLEVKLDNLCRDVIRLRDNNQCQKCDKLIKGTDSHASHIVAKGSGASMRRFDLLNIILFCTHCHFQFWHDNPTESARWFAQKFPVREHYLEKYRYGKPAPISTPEMETLYETLKQKLSDLKKESECK